MGKQSLAHGKLPWQSHPAAREVSGCGGAWPECLPPLTLSSPSTTPVDAEHQALPPTAPAFVKHRQVFSCLCALLLVRQVSTHMELPGSAVLPSHSNEAPTMPCTALAPTSLISSILNDRLRLVLRPSSQHP